MNTTRCALAVVGVALVLALAACRTTAPPSSPSPGSLESRVVVVDREGNVVPFGVLIEELATVDAVFLGETHVDETTHDVEAAIVDRLLETRDGEVVLAMEMFSRDVQSVLDEYLAGEMDESTFRRRARAWSNYATGYRAMVESAREWGAPVVGSNAPRALTRKISAGKADTFDSLTPPESEWVPPRLHPNSAEYWERFNRAVRGHLGASTDPESLLYSVQSLWDNTMGWSCAQALEAHPQKMVVHVNGGFHSYDGEGTVAQFRVRAPEASVRTVAIHAVEQPHEVDREARGDDAEADFVVYARRRGRGLNEGTHAVRLGGELRYRLHVPRGASAEKPVPLLIWLDDDGRPASDVLRYWRERMGEEAAIAVVEPPFPQQEDRLYWSGRWFFPTSLFENIGGLSGGVSRIEEYIEKHYPIDAERVAIAGLGSGGTVAAWMALRGYTETPLIAWQPTVVSRLRESGLPSPPDDPERERGVLVPREADREWWKTEAGTYEAEGYRVSFRDLEGGGPLAEAERDLRTRWSLPATPTISGEMVLLVGGADGPLAELWGELVAMKVAETGRHVESVDHADLPRFWLDRGGIAQVWRLAFEHEYPDDPSSGALRYFTAKDVSASRAVPWARGPFGGTTVVVLPGDASESTLDEWQRLADPAVLMPPNRFFRVRVARNDANAEDGLGAVLTRLESEGRRNILIVPAAFCADAETMRELHAIAAPLASRLQLDWRPGLGAGLSFADDAEESSGAEESSSAEAEGE